LPETAWSKGERKEGGNGKSGKKRGNATHPSKKNHAVCTNLPHFKKSAYGGFVAGAQKTVTKECEWLDSQGSNLQKHGGGGGGEGENHVGLTEGAYKGETNGLAKRPRKKPQTLLFFMGGPQCKQNGYPHQNR